MSLAQKVTGVGITGATAAGSAMAVVPAPYDSMRTDTQSGAANASIVFPATVGKRWVIATVACSLSGVNFIPIQIVDGATVLLQEFLQGSAGVQDTLNLSGLAYVGSLGAAVKVWFNASPGVGNWETVNAGAYLI